MSERTAEYGVVRRRESPRNIKTNLLLCCASWLTAAASLLVFSGQGRIDYRAGAAIIVGGVAGGTVGARIGRLLPPDLVEPFTTRELSKTARQPVRLAHKMVYSLREMGVLVAVGKRGRAVLYTRVK